MLARMPVESSASHATDMRKPWNGAMSARGTVSPKTSVNGVVARRLSRAKVVRGAREIGRGGDQDQAALALLRLERGDERARHLEARRLGVRGRGRGDRRRDHRAFAQWREGGRDERNATTPRREPGATPRARPPLR